MSLYRLYENKTDKLFSLVNTTRGDCLLFLEKGKVVLKSQWALLNSQNFKPHAVEVSAFLGIYFDPNHNGYIVLVTRAVSLTSHVSHPKNVHKIKRCKFISLGNDIEHSNIDGLTKLLESGKFIFSLTEDLTQSLQANSNNISYPNYIFLFNHDMRSALAESLVCDQQCKTDVDVDNWVTKVIKGSFFSGLCDKSGFITKKSVAIIHRIDRFSESLPGLSEIEIIVSNVKEDHCSSFVLAIAPFFLSCHMKENALWFNNGVTESLVTFLNQLRQIKHFYESVHVIHLRSENITADNEDEIFRAIKTAQPISKLDNVYFDEMNKKNFEAIPFGSHYDSKHPEQTQKSLHIISSFDLKCIFGRDSVLFPTLKLYLNEMLSPKFWPKSSPSSISRCDQILNSEWKKFVISTVTQDFVEQFNDLSSRERNTAPSIARGVQDKENSNSEEFPLSISTIIIKTNPDRDISLLKPLIADGDNLSDILAIGFLPLPDMENYEFNPENDMSLLSEVLNQNIFKNYCLIRSESFLKMSLIVFARHSIAIRMKNIHCCSKHYNSHQPEIFLALGISFEIDQVKIALACVNMNDNYRPFEAKNKNLTVLLNGLNFANDLKFLDHEVKVLFGSFSYQYERTNENDSCIKNKDWNTLVKFDLFPGKKRNPLGFMKEFIEPEINFEPLLQINSWSERSLINISMECGKFSSSEYTSKGEIQNDRRSIKATHELIIQPIHFENNRIDSTHVTGGNILELSLKKSREEMDDAFHSAIGMIKDCRFKIHDLGSTFKMYLIFPSSSIAYNAKRSLENNSTIEDILSGVKTLSFGKIDSGIFDSCRTVQRRLSDDMSYFEKLHVLQKCLAPYTGCFHRSENGSQNGRTNSISYCHPDRRFSLQKPLRNTLETEGSSQIVMERSSVTTENDEDTLVNTNFSSNEDVADISYYGQEEKDCQISQCKDPDEFAPPNEPLEPPPAPLKQLDSSEELFDSILPNPPQIIEDFKRRPSCY